MENRKDKYLALSEEIDFDNQTQIRKAIIQLLIERKSPGLPMLPATISQYNFPIPGDNLLPIASGVKIFFKCQIKYSSLSRGSD